MELSEQINWVDVEITLDELIPWENNPRLISEDSARRMVAGWLKFGQVEKIAIGPNNELYNGHQRLKVLMAAFGPGFKIKAIRSDRAMTEAEKRELLLLLHKGAVGEFDWEKMPNMFDFEELLRAGFTRQELQMNFDFTRAGARVAEPKTDQANELKEKWGVELGQIWQLGVHKLSCNDSTDPAGVGALLGGSVPNLCVTDPPYGVNYDAGWRNDRLGEGNRRTGAVQNDDRANWTPAFELFPGAILYCYHASLQSSESFQMITAAGFEIRNQIIWKKSGFQISRGHYHWNHEPVWYAVKAGQKAFWIGDRSQTTIWEIPLDSNIKGGHSTQKPIECMARPIRNHTGDVYDPFSGTGTTIFAAELNGRVCWAMDIDPGWVAVTLERWLETFGVEPLMIK